MKPDIQTPVVSRNADWKAEVNKGTYCPSNIINICLYRIENFIVAL